LANDASIVEFIYILYEPPIIPLKNLTDVMDAGFIEIYPYGDFTGRLNEPSPKYVIFERFNNDVDKSVMVLFIEEILEDKSVIVELVILFAERELNIPVAPVRTPLRYIFEPVNPVAPEEIILGTVIEVDKFIKDPV